jgi:hypothetical protein
VAVTVRADALVRGVEELGMRLADRMNEEIVSELRNNASRRTGAMADSVEVEDGPSLSGTVVASKIIVGVEYGIYQDQGTGIYGPEGHPIEPRSAKVLRFDSAVLGIVFARSVRGSEPTRWWTKAMFPLIARRVSAGG